MHGRWWIGSVCGTSDGEQYEPGCTDGDIERQPDDGGDERLLDAELDDEQCDFLHGERRLVGEQVGAERESVRRSHNGVDYLHLGVHGCRGYDAEVSDGESRRGTGGEYFGEPDDGVGGRCFATHVELAERHRMLGFRSMVG